MASLAKGEMRTRVKALLAEGFTNQEIADMTGLSVRGVKWHVERLYLAYGLSWLGRWAEADCAAGAGNVCVDRWRGYSYPPGICTGEKTAMPTVLISFKKSPSGHIMFHGFTGPSDAVTEKEQTGHAKICPQYGPALEKGDTFDFSIDVDELPEFDEESLGEWIDEMFGLESEDEEEEESEGDEEEEDDEG